MCFSYSVNFNAEALKSRIQLDEIMIPESGFFFNGFTYPFLPVIISQDTKNICIYKHWGLIPGWAKDEAQAAELKKLGLNAKGETVSQKPMFRHAFSHGRCLVPASGFYEWREVNRKKFPYFIYPPNHGVFLFAGIAERWVNRETGEETDTYCIVTCEANSLLKMIHNQKQRMPLILDDEGCETWLRGSGEAALALVKPCAENLTAAHTISPLASSVRSDRNVPEVQREYQYPELAPGLF